MGSISGWPCSNREGEGRLQILVAVSHDPYCVAQAVWYLENSAANPLVCFCGCPGCLAPTGDELREPQALHGAGIRLRLLIQTFVVMV